LGITGSNVFATPYACLPIPVVWSFTTLPRRIFVDADANGVGDGSSWADAYRYLQCALNAASSSDKPVEILVAQGVYKPDEGIVTIPEFDRRLLTFQLFDDVIVKGGYAGFGEPEPDARDIELYESILSGDLQGDDGPDFTNNDENSYHVVTVSGIDETAVLDGFTITAGNANSHWYYGHDSGGGMYINFGSATVIKCTFIGNSSTQGGGIYNYESDLMMANCIVSGNQAMWSVGGICVWVGIPSPPGPCFMSRVCDVTLINCTFAENQAEGGKALVCGSCNDLFPSKVHIVNCILWDGWDEIRNYDGSTITITYSDILDGWPGIGNIGADPCFVDAGGGDLRLSSGSACIDAGYNNAPNLPDIDMDGHPRIIDGDCDDTKVVDMGTYELNYVYMGEFDYNCEVDFVDFSIFGLAWMTEPGDFNWDFACDLSKPVDNYIDWRDAAILCDNWLTKMP
jgi:hypothetical protein